MQKQYHFLLTIDVRVKLSGGTVWNIRTPLDMSQRGVFFVKLHYL